MVFKHILCISELSFLSRNAEYAALKLAQRFQGKITILSCAKYYLHSPNNYFDENIIQPIENNLDYKYHLKQKENETKNYFLELQRRLKIDLKDNISYVIKLENEVTATLDFLEKNKDTYDLIVVAKENNTHWERLLFGSPGKDICDQTQIPTLLFPCTEEWSTWEPQGILVGSSLRNEHYSTEILGAEIAKKFETSLTLMHVIPENINQFASNYSNIFPLNYIPTASTVSLNDELIIKKKEQLASIVKILEKKIGQKKNTTHMELGRVEESIMNYIKTFSKNNLLVIGSRGENALKRFFLGNNTDALEEACRIPILIVFAKSHN